MRQGHENKEERDIERELTKNRKRQEGTLNEKRKGLGLQQE